MKTSKIKFDDDLSMYIFIKYLNTEIGITLSDDLYASEEKLTLVYREKIACFIDNIPQWYNKASDAIISWAKKTYNINSGYNEIKLMRIYVLFEQRDNELFGLDFRVKFDIEHGCGIKIKGKDENYEIVEIGEGDVAY